ncbi:DUF4328 domain-containing protein [Streptomyces sp. NPDC059445]|uniref:DUF4328 domain-containing protein n=1 Tax=Streptomyces sp. NPDC059445 TaxID=3346832 RepID=UPI0036871973
MTMPSTPQRRARATTSRNPAAPPRSFAPYGFGRLRSPVALGRAAAGVLGLTIAVDLYAIWADLTMRTVVGAAADGASGYEVWHRIEVAEPFYVAAGHAHRAVLITAVVVYLNWFLRVRDNSVVFSPFGQSKSRAWARWGWFVPVVNLWLPRRIMQDVWDASRPEGARSGYGLLNAWWALSVIDASAGQAAPTPSLESNTFAEVRDGAGRLALTHALDSVAAVLAIVVVLKLTRMQDRKAQAGPGVLGG